VDRAGYRSRPRAQAAVAVKRVEDLPVADPATFDLLIV
jgi:hypothetical protein